MEKFGQSLALSKNLLIAVRRLSGDGLALSVSLRSPALPLGATATTAASGGNREELLGQRPAGCERQRSRRWEPQPGQWHAAGVTERFYHGPVLDSYNCRCKQKTT